MEAYQERVVAEKQELDEKLAKLKTFCYGESPKPFDGLDPIDKDLLEQQYTVMENYSMILSERIKRFGSLLASSGS